MPTIDSITQFAAAPGQATAPDSITTADGFVWVAYTNGASSTGGGGDSTIVQYDLQGDIVHTYSLPGYVDGLKFNPQTGEIWALQNQDGNSTLSLIDPKSHKVIGPLQYAVPSSTQGYDDVVFDGKQVFLSFTNPPGTTGDPTVVMLTNGDHPHGALTTKTILTDGVSGFESCDVIFGPSVKAIAFWQSDLEALGDVLAHQLALDRPLHQTTNRFEHIARTMRLHAVDQRDDVFLRHGCDHEIASRTLTKLFQDAATRASGATTERTEGR